MSTEQQQTKGHDMTHFWRLVSNDGGLVTGTWWVTRPDEHGKQHVQPIDVTMWSEGRHHGFTLHLNDFTAFIKGGEVEPIRVRSRHSHIESEANARLDEITAAARAVAASVDWPEKRTATEGTPA